MSTKNYKQVNWIYYIACQNFKYFKQIYIQNIYTFELIIICIER